MRSKVSFFCANDESANKKKDDVKRSQSPQQQRRMSIRRAEVRCQIERLLQNGKDEQNRHHGRKKDDDEPLPFGAGGL